MKIIKQGISEDELNRNLKQPKRFKCEICGCVFEAYRNEYKIEIAYPYMYYFCDCPNCKTRVLYYGIQDGFNQTEL